MEKGESQNIIFFRILRDTYGSNVVVHGIVVWTHKTVTSCINAAISHCKNDVVNKIVFPEGVKAV